MLYFITNILFKDLGFTVQYWIEQILTTNNLRNWEIIINDNIMLFEIKT